MSSDALLRLALVTLVVLGALGTAWLWRRATPPRHRPVSTAGLGLPAGVIIFTSTDCGNCAEARRRAETLGLPMREVTWELEPALFERAGVESVPITVFVDGDERVVAQVVGIPSRAALRSGAAALRG